MNKLWTLHNLYGLSENEYKLPQISYQQTKR